MKKKRLCVLIIPLVLMTSVPAHADIFGGDVAVLMQILAQAIQTVTELQSVLSTGQDTLGLLRDVNAGVANGLNAIQILDPRFNPGVYGDLRDPSSVLKAIQQVYGKVPNGADYDLIQSQDQSVAEVISMNRNLYDYADQVDREKDQILFHAQGVSPQGAGRLENQALGILIGVTTELLRTQSQMLKLMAQNMAYQDRNEKASAENFHDNYASLAREFQNLPKETNLPKFDDNSKNNGGDQ